MITKQRGFTLLEILVALAITAIVAAMAYSSLDGSIRLAEASEQASERLQKINRVFDILRKDFIHVAPRVVRSPDGDGFVDALSFNEYDLPMLKFTRNGKENPLPERFQRSHLERVNYHWDGEKLIRYSWPIVDRYDDSEPVEIVLLENVTQFSVRFMKAETEQNVESNQVVNKAVWVDQWPEEDLANPRPLGVGSDSLPMAIEISMEIEGWGQVTRLFEFVEMRPAL